MNIIHTYSRSFGHRPGRKVKQIARQGGRKVKQIARQGGRKVEAERLTRWKEGGSRETDKVEGRWKPRD